jgi:hypothetical protein
MAPPGRGKPSTSNSGESDGEDVLATAFSEFARDVEHQQDFAATLDEVVRAAIVLIPGCDEASISMIRSHRRLESHAASGALSLSVDELQDSLGEGPCFDSAYSGETIRVSDMAREARWPRFASAAVEAGAVAMLCFQLYVKNGNFGALNLYSRTVDSFDDESEHVGLIFAGHAAVAFAASSQDAAAGRRFIASQLIGQAQGILMERYKLTADQAFLRLVRVSQQRNAKLRDVADGLVHHGQFDEPAASTRHPAGSP